MFELLGYERMGRSHDLIVYLESDGNIRLTPTVLSSDPTPLRPIALELAVQDDSPSLLYLARPCQYLSDAQRRECNPLYWDTRRFSPEVVAALSDALEQSKARFNARRLILVGYSGGGTLANLLAGHRDDVVGLVTVAAPLDVDAWVRHHRISPVTGSLDAAMRTKLAQVRQIHFAGARDWQVPPVLLETYMRTLPPTVANARILSDQDHDCCWGAVWQRLLSVGVRPWLRVD